MTRRAFPTGVRVAAVLAVALSSASVLVRVTEEGTGRPLFGAIATLLDADGGVVRSALTDERGRFLFVGAAPGTYRVRAEMIGHATATSAPFDLDAGASLVRVLALSQQAIEMEGIAVEARRGRCRVRPAEGLQVARVWDEARKALAASALTDRERVYRYRTLRYVRDLDRGTLAVRNERRERSSGYLRTPFESRPAEELMREGFVRPAATGDLYFAPDAEVLLSDAFLDSHCFRLRQGKKHKETEGLVGLAFQPVRGREIPDISGVLWLDPTTSELRWLAYRYEYINRDFESNLVGGRVSFQRLPDGTWIIPEWWIRMPTVGISRDAQGRRKRYVAGYRQVGGLVTQVQESTGAVVLEGAGGTVEGIVLDSLEAGPLPGATVRIIGSDRTTVTGTDGRFRFAGLPEATYRVAYTHPYLEGLGHEPEPRTVTVRKGQVVAVRFVAPAAVDVLAERCGKESRIEGTAALLGWVWSGPDRRGLAGATVRITWSGYSFKAVNPYQVRGRDPDRGDGWWFRAGEHEEGVEIDTDRRGFFRVCAVPEEVPLRVTARYGSDESEPVSVRIPPDVAAQGVELTVAVRGAGDVTGTITAWETGAPVAGARVTVAGVDGEALTDDRGRFELHGVPGGARVIRVEHLGFAEARDTLAVRPGETVDVAVRMVPEAVRIEGVQVRVRSRRATARKAGGAARTEVTREDIADLEGRAQDLIDVLRLKAGPRLQITTLPSRQGMAVDLCIRTTRSAPSISDQMAFSGTCRPVMVVLNGMVLSLIHI